MTKVLVVDDDPVLRQITVMALQRDGLDVTDAGSAQEALEKFDTSFDAVVLDLMMPDMDGHALLAKLQELQSDVKAAFLTARHEKDAELLAAGACGVLRKPFDPLTLGRQLREMAGI